MPANQRYTTILELLDKDGIVHTAELVKLMGSETTEIALKPGLRNHPQGPGISGQPACPGYTGDAVPADSGTP